ncbi:MAG: hypothetical protein N3I86_12695 [Verrucomicrobiae bacterium]|nr:hypothetical protein [Verrucomicrobiae bacterium]MDW8308729.1 hypothetical protein [Verrucomicrobiales bacterium]
MALWKKKSDPLSERARALQRQIATLEAQIRDLQTTLARTPAAPAHTACPLRTPPANVVPRAVESRPAPTPPRAEPQEPVFEEVSRSPLKTDAAPPEPQDLYNEMGVRKFDFTALVRRWRQRWHHTPTLNPRLISYLAAGGVQGLRPLRKEKRIARNRFLLLVAILLLLLFGTLWMFLQHR